MECIFCKIVEGDLPCYKIYEDKRLIAFLDINPVNKGHVLVCPKDHYLNFLDTPVDLIKDLIVAAHYLAAAVTEAVGAKDFNLGINNGKIAGQMIDHVHFHIIPRFTNDNLHPWPGKTLADDEMKRIMGNIKKLV
ncbi:HIT family protein [Patescibacteria group bacterium]|nr:HIT family protein [Patescibacteria group bacterium]